MQRLSISQELQIELHALAENENQETQTTFTNVDASTNRQCMLRRALYRILSLRVPI